MTTQAHAMTTQPTRAQLTHAQGQAHESGGELSPCLSLVEALVEAQATHEGEGVAEGALATHICPPTAVAAVYQCTVKVRLLRRQAEIVVGVDERRPQRLDGQSAVESASLGMHRSAAATSTSRSKRQGLSFWAQGQPCGNRWDRERWAADGLLRARRAV